MKKPNSHLFCVEVKAWLTLFPQSEIKEAKVENVPLLVAVASVWIKPECWHQDWLIIEVSTLSQLIEKERERVRQTAPLSATEDCILGSRWKMKRDKEIGERESRLGGAHPSLIFFAPFVNPELYPRAGVFGSFSRWTPVLRFRLQVRQTGGVCGTRILTPLTFWKGGGPADYRHVAAWT